MDKLEKKYEDALNRRLMDPAEVFQSALGYTALHPATGGAGVVASNMYKVARYFEKRYREKEYARFKKNAAKELP